MKEIIDGVKSLNVGNSISSEPTGMQSVPRITENVSQDNACLQHGNGNLAPDLHYIQNNLHELSHTTHYSNISIRDSSNVHLGHKINYNGELDLNLVNDSNNDCRISVIQNENDSNAILINSVPRIYISSCTILPRNFWSIKRPKEEYHRIQEPVKLVIISHTATSSSNSQTENIQLLRDIQSFHVDTQLWNDIAYNFLIGSDGNVYEGRGWGIEGAHTFGYNNRSIGVSFIGCFINRMPTDEALNACKNLLKRGVEAGHLSKYYKLLGHRQCKPTESPGTKLFEEIMKWDHFYNKSIENDILSDNES